MTKLTAVASLVLSLPVVAVSACSSPQHPSTQPGTTPPVNSGSPGSSATTSPPASGESLTAQLNAPDGRAVAAATFDFTGGYATVTVKTVTPESSRPVSTAYTFTRSASVSRTRLLPPVARPAISCPRAVTTRRPGIPGSPKAVI